MQLTTRGLGYSRLTSRCFKLDAGLAFVAEISARRIEKAGSQFSDLKPEN
jgi:hypothetical protein